MPRNSTPDKQNQIQQIIYIHGINSEERPSCYLRNWNRALFGEGRDPKTELAWWADITNPKVSHLKGQGKNATDSFGAATKKLASLIAESVSAQTPEQGIVGARWNLPGFIGGPLTWLGTRFLRDVDVYLYNQEKRQRIQQRIFDKLEQNKVPTLLIGHSLGSVIALDVVHRNKLDNRGYQIEGLFTLGSPLGMISSAIEETLGWEHKSETNLKCWFNFADRIDPVAGDDDLANNFWKQIKGKANPNFQDYQVRNTQRSIKPPFAHDAVGYLETPEMRSKANQILPLDFSDPSRRRTMSKDLQYAILDALDNEEESSKKEETKIPLLIELTQSNFTENASGLKVSSLSKRGERVAELIKNHVIDTPDILDRYVAAFVSPARIPEVLLLLKNNELPIHRTWLNSKKKALATVASERLQVKTARLGYSATGEGINWAVLDTGIQSNHPHFIGIIDATYDATVQGVLKTVPNMFDPNGHGTHVAGIIGGGADPKFKERITAVAPGCKLTIYKVLEDDGSGFDSYIIKALDHIYRTNEESHELIIHGVNLSLGGGFDPETYACGHSPICKELRRLWKQGVVVCVAAGNEGHIRFTSLEGNQISMNPDLSIGDPANLEECIAVGSINGKNPHGFGISWFSSRGPTADGRCKPDVVAPGERINSAHSNFDSKSKNYYIELSGTSMACPAVSGLIASFLSVRREFIGRPDEVKSLLKQCSTDLGRDPYHQGAGMPNLVKMLLET
ncbi:MAG: S8 family peptidase [Candidatus Sumerlaeia bacterium]|nr:S8 family peptidase [Candidatus Sumerlaeia bacterium]